MNSLQPGAHSRSNTFAMFDNRSSRHDRSVACAGQPQCSVTSPGSPRAGRRLSLMVGKPGLDGCPGRVARGAILNCAEYPLDPQAVAEGGLRLAVLGNRGDQVDGLVGEAVLVT
jgi:hypothetical protein